MKRSRRRLLAAMAAGAALLPALTPAARANNGIQLIAQSAKSVGRGGAEAAVGDDVLASITNPATLVENDRIRLDVSFGLFFERVRTTSTIEDDVDVNTLGVPIPAVGVVWDPFKPEAVGDEPPPPGGSGTRVAFTLWQPIVLVASPTFSISHRLNERWSIGGAINPLITNLNLTITGKSGGPVGAQPDFVPNGLVRLHYRPDGTPITPPDPFPSPSNQISWGEIFTLATSAAIDTGAGAAPTIEIKLKNVQGFGISGQLGVLYEAIPSVLSIGLGLRSPGIIFNPHGDGSVDLTPAVTAIQSQQTIGPLVTAAFETYLPDRGRAGYKADYDVSADSLKFPANVALGASWYPTPRWLVAADVKYINWENASSKITIRGSRGTNNDFNEINGGPTLDYTIAIDWKDQLVFAAGTAVQANDWLVLRTGVNYGRNPMDAEFLIGNSLATELHASLGASFLVGSWDLDLAYMYGFPESAGDARFLRSTSEQHFLYLGVGYRF